MPNIAAITSSPEVVRESTPRMLITMPSKTMMAMFVARNNTILNTIILH
jgi:hypothetical protein